MNKRIVIYPKDVMLLTGKSERSARMLLSEIKNYVTIFVDDSVYDPVPAYLLRALKIVAAHG